MSYEEDLVCYVYNHLLKYYYLCILFQASADQSKIDTALLFYMGTGISMCISVVSSIAITCQVAWPSVIAVLPLLLLNIWYRVLIQLLQYIVDSDYSSY
jgi:hypothetical protein